MGEITLLGKKRGKKEGLRCVGKGRLVKRKTYGYGTARRKEEGGNS